MDFVDLNHRGFLIILKIQKLCQEQMSVYQVTKNINRPQSLAQTTAVPHCVYQQRNGPAYLYEPF